VTVESHESKEELILYLSRQMDIEYSEAKEKYENSTQIIN
jgi:hypothetical protein